jgi:four helix bundle protein
MSDQENRRDLAERTEDYALRIIRTYTSLPKTSEAQVIGRQVLRSGTSVGAQYREARRARSTAEFISKIESALQELDETEYWLGLLCKSGIVKAELLEALMCETNELIAILTTSAKTAKSRRKSKKEELEKKLSS